MNPLRDERVEAIVDEENRPTRPIPYTVPEPPDHLLSALGIPTSDPEYLRAYRKCWLAFRKYDSRQEQIQKGIVPPVALPRNGDGFFSTPKPDAHSYTTPRELRAIIVADWVLWKMCPAENRPATWPQSESDIMKFHGLGGGAALNGMIAKIRGSIILNSMFLPFDPEDLNRLADRQVRVALEEGIRNPEKRDPRWVKAAYERTGAVGKGVRNSVTVKGNAIVQQTLNAVPMTPKEQKEAEARLAYFARHYLGEPTKEVPREVEALEVPEPETGE